MLQDDGSILSWSDDIILRLWSSDGEPIWVVHTNNGISGQRIKENGNLAVWWDGDNIRESTVQM